MRARHALWVVLPATLLAALLARGAARAGEFIVTALTVPDHVPVSATIEGQDAAPARVRTGGTISAILVHRGALVAAGQVLATIDDPKLTARLAAARQAIAAAEAANSIARTNLARAAPLTRTGAVSRLQRDQYRAEAAAAAAALAARKADLAVLREQRREGEVLAPLAGRVASLPVSVGMVVLPGETIATLALGRPVLRLAVPEADAPTLSIGEAIAVHDAGAGVTGLGKIVRIYPDIVNGLVRADMAVPGLSDRFVGRHVLVDLPVAARPRIVVPAAALVSRFGMDFVWLETATGVIAVPVQQGGRVPDAALPDAVAILSGLRPGDRLRLP